MLNKHRSLTIRALNNKLLLTIKQFGAKMKTSKELKARASSHFYTMKGEQHMKTCLQEKYGLFINGQWQPASDGKTFKSYNPANGELLAECAQATDADLDLAVDSAWKAWDSWKQTTPAERAKILNRIADIIDENAEHLAMVETLDNGKPIRETMAIDIP